MSNTDNASAFEDKVVDAEVYLVPVSDILVCCNFSAFKRAVSKLGDRCEVKFTDTLGVKVAELQLKSSFVAGVGSEVFNV